MIGRVYVEDEERGGAYFLEGGALCHAPFEGGRFRFDHATQIDTYDIIDPDPGWDFARWARDRLAEAEIDRWEKDHAVGCRPDINCECEP